jgi:RluA family pseudouridine synthase
MLSYTVTPPDHARRLESFLRTLMPLASAGYCRKLIRGGAARLNGTSAAPDTFLSLGDRVTLKESAATISLLTGTRPVLDILYEDDQMIVFNKPPGLPMHQTAEQEDNLVDAGMAYMTWRDSPCKLYPVNRLDRGTSGAVIMAKSSTNAGIYGRQVKETGLDKLYLALVAGQPDEEGLITEPLDGKDSETRYAILLPGDDCTLLAVVPISGRMHQIRRHLEGIGHPVLGDKRYGGGEPDEFNGFALHSFRTVVIRPEAGALTVCAPLPHGLIELCSRRGIDTERLLRAAVPKLAGVSAINQEVSP